MVKKAAVIPGVSVIIPVFGGVDVIGVQLQHLCEQKFAHVEIEHIQILVCDNGNNAGLSDVLSAIDRDRSAESLNQISIEYVDATAHPGVSFARNCGFEHATHDFILYCDADDYVSDIWIDELTTSLCEHQLVTGPIRPVGNYIDARPFLKRNSEKPITINGEAILTSGCNIGVTREAQELIGKWREDFRQGEDTVFSARAYVRGIRAHFNPNAAISYETKKTLKAVTKQAFNFGKNQPCIQRELRPLGLAPQNSISMSIKNVSWPLRNVFNLSKPERRLEWIFQACFVAGKIVGSITHRSLAL